MSSNKKKKTILSLLVLAVMLIVVGGTYAFIQLTLTGTRNVVLTAGTLSLELQEDDNNLAITDALPMYDEVGMIQDAFTFRLINNTTVATDYTIKLSDVTTGDKLSTNVVKYGLTKDGSTTIGLISDLTNLIIDTGTIGTAPINYELRFWIDSEVTDNTLIAGKSLSYKLVIEAGLSTIYQEYALNGATPVLTNNLVPVTIADDGIVTKADTTKEWYNYTNKVWANAVVLIDNTQSYDNGAVIPESNIESYFVWIPRYRYKIFDEGNYTEATTVENAVQTIEVEFETKEVAASTGTTEGSWLTHPAFTAFDVNGLWVGKFESGYSGATTTAEAQINEADPSKLIVKPNVYSWRSITAGNAFEVSYNYLREDESHMMKNTEWGAVAYLQHSAYGSQTSVRINNNSAYITGYAGTEEPTLGYSATSIEGNRQESTALNVDGTYTKRYNTITGYLASTTGNISGIYDMSGGTWEYVMGYNTQATTGDLSGITTLYSDFFENSVWDKYYDKYSNSGTLYQNYNNRILGDAMGEMGPFGSQSNPEGVTRYISSWYGDYGQYATVSDPWFARGGNWYDGSAAGAFSFSPGTGSFYTLISFRPVLAP